MIINGVVPGATRVVHPDTSEDAPAQDVQQLDPQGLLARWRDPAGVSRAEIDLQGRVTCAAPTATGHAATRGWVESIIPGTPGLIETQEIVTTDATPDQVLWSKTLEANTSYDLQVVVTARGGGARYRNRWLVAADRGVGDALLEDTVETVIPISIGGLSARLATSGTQLRSLVTGASGTTVRWGARVDVTRVTQV